MKMINSRFTVVKIILSTTYIMTLIGLVAFRDYKGGEGVPLTASDIREIPAPRPDAIIGVPQSGTQSYPQSGVTMPNLENFEKVSQAVSEALNTVNVTQENQAQIDPTDLNENFNNFSLTKFEAVLKGERKYKYLKLEKYWYHNEQKVQAIVVIPDSEDGRYAMEYVELVLTTLNKDYSINTSQVGQQEIQQIARDVNEIGRFTCIKFLRLVWAVFSDGESNPKGLFPQVYQMQIVDAGDLANQNGGDDDLFTSNNLNVVKSSQVKYANVSNANPDDRIDLFNRKVVVFFRPTDKKTSAADNGHVGVGRLEAHYDEVGNFTDFTISFVEVMGTTGQSFYSSNMSLNEFRKHLYFNNPSPNPLKEQIVGWFINR